MTLHDDASVRDQYRDSSNFDARVDLHARYSTNKQGWTEFVFSKFDLPSAASVLEVGCGPAWLWRSNQERVPVGWRVVATDMSAGMATEARLHLDERFTLLVTDAQALPFEAETFDAIVANHMLYHVPDLGAALDEFVRVLRPGGKLYAATNGPAHFKEVREILGIEWRYVDMFGLESGPDKLSGHFDDVTVERYDDALEVPAVEPVVAYVRSMSSFWDLEPEREARLRAHAEEAIARNGVYRIAKDAGIITARRR